MLKGPKARGMYVYAADESTDILCLSAKPDDQQPILWVPQHFRHLIDNVPFLHGYLVLQDAEFKNLIERADEIHAHNSTFERLMWYHHMFKKYGFPEIPFSKWRCTAAKAASFALPRALGYACEALDLIQQKDMIGYKIMMKMCKPNNKGVWHEDPDDFKLLCKYCIQDVEAEYELDQALPDLSDLELEVWRLDQRINDRGIEVDMEAIDNLIYKVRERERQLLMEIQKITKGRINSTRQVAATRTWLEEQGTKLENLQKATVIETLAGTVPDNVRKLLEIRQSLSMSSVSKLDAMKKLASADNRLRGAFLYHGASTGRWAGKGIQPHNYPRESYEDEDIQQILSEGVSEVEVDYGGTFSAASRSLRGMLIAKKGKHLYCADYSSIEARVLAWLANEVSVIQSFKDGLDPYIVAATQVYNKKYEDITPDERFVGKTIVLACGYQGWVGAFRQMANEDVNKLTDDQISKIIGQWRDARANTVRFWKGVEQAAMYAVKTGKAYSYGPVKYGMRGRFLHCRLPSGRLLSYCDPHPIMIETKYKQMKEVISFMGVDSKTKKWCPQTTYGGKLTENIDQALSRDILADAMLQMDMLGYNIVMHVHDEIVTEDVDEDIEEIENIMAVTPAWAAGCPIGAEGWVGDRYRKA